LRPGTAARFAAGGLVIGDGLPIAMQAGVIGIRCLGIELPNLWRPFLQTDVFNPVSGFLTDDFPIRSTCRFPDLEGRRPDDKK